MEDTYAWLRAVLADLGVTRRHREAAAAAAATIARRSTAEEVKSATPIRETL